VGKIAKKKQSERVRFLLIRHSKYSTMLSCCQKYTPIEWAIRIWALECLLALIYYFQHLLSSDCFNQQQALLAPYAGQNNFEIPRNQLIGVSDECLLHGDKKMYQYALFWLWSKEIQLDVVNDTLKVCTHRS